MLREKYDAKQGARSRGDTGLLKLEVGGSKMGAGKDLQCVSYQNPKARTLNFMIVLPFPF